jgi:hypothetical protein
MEVMTLLTRIGIVALTAASIGAAQTTFGAQLDEPCAAEATDVAVQTLRNRVHNARLYVTWAKAQCLSYQVENCNKSMVGVAIFEVHSNDCR